MSKQMKQSIVIENKLGAGSTLGTEYVAHAAPDGYTLLLASNPQAWASALFRHLSFDPVADFEPISLFTREPGVLVINPEMSVQTYGAMVKSPSGYPVQSPYVSIANRQTEIMMRIASEFGFTPASRSRISTPGQRQPNLFDMLENVSGERDGSKGDDE
jgi:tripartite-type tricarboxylate transporter receptor subunit TctC